MSMIPDDYEIDRLREEVRRRPYEVAQQVWLLAALAMKDGIEQRAESAFRRMFELKPLWTQLHYDVVAYWGGRGRNPDPIVRIFAAAHDRHPNDAMLAYAHGLALQAAAMQQEAIEVYRQAIRKHPSMAVLHHNLGIAYNLYGRRDEAAAACHRAAELEPSFAEPHFLLGSYYGLQRKRKEAMHHTQRFLDLAHPYLEQYVGSAELGMAVFTEAEEQKPYQRFWNKVRGRRK